MSRLVRRIFSFSILLIVILSSVFGVELDSSSFDLLFIKPPTNEFFFSNPLNPNEFFGTDAARGITFKDPVNNEISVDVGITYKIESVGKLEVFCNSNLDLSGEYMLDTSSGVGLNLTVSEVVKNQGSENLIPSSNNPAQSLCTVNVSESMEQRESKVLRLTLNTTGVLDGQYTGYIVMKLTVTN